MSIPRPVRRSDSQGRASGSVPQVNSNACRALHCSASAAHSAESAVPDTVDNGIGGPSPSPGHRLVRGAEGWPGRQGTGAAVNPPPLSRCQRPPSLHAHPPSLHAPPADLEQRCTQTHTCKRHVLPQTLHPRCAGAMNKSGTSHFPPAVSAFTCPSLSVHSRAPERGGGGGRKGGVSVRVGTFGGTHWVGFPGGNCAHRLSQAGEQRCWSMTVGPIVPLTRTASAPGGPFHAGHCFVTPRVGGGGVVWGSGQPRPTRPPTSEKFSSGKK